MNIAKAIKHLRSDRGMTISELSRKSGVAKGLISDLESGKRTNPCVDTIQKLANAVGWEFELAFTPKKKPIKTTTQDVTQHPLWDLQQW